MGQAILPLRAAAVTGEAAGSGSGGGVPFDVPITRGTRAAGRLRGILHVSW
jgi:hypothetical protein